MVVAGRVMPGGLPAFNVKGLAMLDYGKQQWDQLACHCAHGFGPETAITGKECFVVRAIEAAAETPAAGEQKQLEATFLGLRTADGVSASLIESWPNALREAAEAQGWLVQQGDRVHLTPLGWLRLDSIIAGA